jgi:adenylate cyclase
MLTTLAQKPLIEKTRYTIKYKGFYWEIDEFHGTNQGLVVAEIELEHADQAFEKPAWIGEEVTNDPRYYNVNLARVPYSQW